MKTLYTWVLVFSVVIKAFPQYLLCTEIPLQYQRNSISFGKSDIADLGDSMMVIPIINLSDTTFYKLSAKLIAVTALPGGTSVIDGTAWKPFAAVLKPGETAYAHFYFTVDSLIPPEFTTGFQLWINDPVKNAFDSCVFDTSFTVNINPQIVPQVLAENSNDAVRIYPVPAVNVLHVSFMPAGEINAVISISDITGKKVMQQRAGAENWDMDVSSLTPGVYFMSIDENGQVRNLKFSVAR